MNIAEMHVWFRQMAQQMGMQNVRAILPEQIDLLINTSITDTINQLIRQNIGITNDRVITDNSKIGQINAFSTLYRVIELDMGYKEFEGNNGKEVGGIFNLQPARARIGNMKTDEQSTDKVIPPMLFIVDLSLSYKPATVGYSTEKATEYILDGEETNFFPVRIIDDAYLADVLNDFILKPRLRSPVITIYNGFNIFDVDENKNRSQYTKFDLYIDKFVKDENTNSYKLINNLLPYKLRLSYIGKPNKVRYGEDIGLSNINCDLPESMHIDVLKHALDLYRIAITGSLQATQQGEQEQQRENLRNNYRNEGNPNTTTQ